MLTNLLKTTAAATLMGAAFMATPAQAADFGFSINIGHPRPTVVYEPAPVVVTRPAVVVERPVTIAVPQRRWVAERYETRTEQVLVTPAHVDRVWVPERVETRKERGRTVTVRHPGYYREETVPAVYETRSYTVKIPGYWEEQPGCVTPAPVVVPAPCGNDKRDECRDDDRWDRRHDSGRFDRRDNDRRDNDRGPIVYRSGYSSR